MSSRPLFRFVQASNLELDRFCAVSGAPTPDQGRLLIDAPFRAAERVFETAVREQAELILLTGGVFEGRHPSTWGASFLARHCERVARHGIQVCWADPGQDRHKSWPRFLATPKNLHILRSHAEDHFRLTTRSGVTVDVHAGTDPLAIRQQCRIESTAGSPPFQIGVLTQAPSNPAALARPIEFWAVHQGDEPGIVSAADGMAQAAGTTQPRHLGTTSRGQCLLVDVGPGFSIGTQSVETGSIRYHVERITVEDSTNWEGLRRRLHSRTDEALQDTIADAVVFQWQLHGHGPVIERLLTPDAANSLQQELRTAFEARSPAPWVTPLLLVPDAVQETRWQRDGSPFGMFVRSLDGLATGTGPDVDLTRVGSGVVRSIDPAAVNIPRPHYQSTIKSNARRQAARVLSDLSR